MRRAGGITAIVLLVAAVVGLAGRGLDVAWQPLVVAGAFAPATLVLALAALVLALAGRHWPVAAAAALVLVAAVVAQVPGLRDRDPVPSDDADVVAVTLNLGLGEAGAAEVVDAVETGDVDLLSVQELTPGAARRLERAGIDAVLPYRLLSPGPDATGVGLWSRWPVSGGRELLGHTMHRVEGSVAIPGGPALPVTVVHVPAPWPGDPTVWAAELAGLAAAGSAASGPRLVLGDVNASPDHAAFRALLTDGVQDAAAGFGWLPTFPSNSVVPPLIAVDHALVRGYAAVDARTIGIDGTDHLGLLVRLRPAPSIGLAS